MDEFLDLYYSDQEYPQDSVEKFDRRNYIQIHFFNRICLLRPNAKIQKK